MIVMRKIIRYWNQNRKQIIIVIAIIAFIIIMLQVVNNLLKTLGSDAGDKMDESFANNANKVKHEAVARSDNV